MRLGALVAVPVLVLAMVAGSLLLPQLLLLTPLVQTQAGTGGAGSQGPLFQGFVYPWTRDLTGGGYNTAKSLQNMRNEAQTFHMNAVIIPIYADMPHRDANSLEWHSTDPDNKQTLSDADYTQAIKDARTAGLVPILDLEVRQQDIALSGSDQSAYWVGRGWFGQSWTQSFPAYTLPNGNSVTITVGPTEHAFFDTYTAFAVYYARISAQLNLPYFIIGDGLSSVSYDTKGPAGESTTKSTADPLETSGGPPGCSGRRDCEWRHMIAAIRGATYNSLVGNHPLPGGNYSGKLIYSASWNLIPGLQSGSNKPEFEGITWWDAVDYIGVNAYFPLTRDADVSVDQLTQAWHGQGLDLAGQGNIYSRLQAVSDKFDKSLVFTSAGYESIAGANAKPDPNQQDYASTTTQDQGEQRFDMEALVTTFNGEPWWQGVFWYEDQPMPYASQPNWQYSTAWAADTLRDSKEGGAFLAGYYHNAPITCQC
jgi:hypothetical protein